MKDSDSLDKALLHLADMLPQLPDREASISSTSGMAGEDRVSRDHSTLKGEADIQRLQDC
jgi:hypothetical protein